MKCVSVGLGVVPEDLDESSLLRIDQVSDQVRCDPRVAHISQCF
jgi:hypothetical protein